MILQDFNIKINTGEVICLCGPSGIGKTTILKLIAGLTKVDKGTLCVEGQRLGYVFQEPRLLPWCSVLENVEMGLYGVLPEDKAGRKALAGALLDKVELKGFAEYYPAQLSGGMRQRVALARAFAVEPDVLLLDEPFSALDYEMKSSLRHYLFELLDWKPCTTILVTHDIEEAVRTGDRIVFLEGRPCHIGYQQIINGSRSERDVSYWLEKIIRRNI